MKKKLPILIGGMLAAVALVGVIGASIAYAQEGTPTAPFGIPGDGHGPRGGRGLGDAELQAAANVLDMTTDELSSALKDGKKLQELADEAGVDFEDVQTAIRAAHEAEMRERIQQAVDDGTMTQEKADWLLEGLDRGFLDGPGFGFGFGRGPHGPGPGQNNNATINP